MTDSVIPQLHLFSSHQRRHSHRSPTRDFIDYQQYKLSRRAIPSSVYETPALNLSRTSRPIPIPVPVPVSVPIIQPIPILSAYQRAYLPPLPLSPVPDPYICPSPPLLLPGRQFIPAPTTYVDYAQQYLMGRTLPILPSAQTARFIGARSTINKNVYNCNCQNQHHHGKGEIQILDKNAYLKKRTEPQPKPQPIPPAKPIINQSIINNPSIKPGPKIIINPPIPQKVLPGEPEIKKDPYLQINTERDPKKQSPKQNKQILTTIIQNTSLYIQQQRRKKPIIASTNQATQTDQQPKSPPQKKKDISNNSTIIMQKFMRTIPVTLDAESFKILMRKKLQQFYNLRIDFQEIPTIDLQDLIETKQQYMETSRDILVRLNQLAGDRKQMTLMYKLVQNKEKKEIFWPDV